VSTDITTRCWNCGSTSNRCAEVIDKEATPHDGDVSLCFDCGQLALIDFSLEDKVRKPTPKEMDELHNNEEVLAMVLAWHVFQQEQRRRRRKAQSMNDQP
jgi:hypothetical protein